jgi:hypothetical protein
MLSFTALSRAGLYTAGSTAITSENGAGQSIAARRLLSLAVEGRQNYRIK